MKNQTADKALKILDKTIADFERAETSPDYNEAENRAFDNLNRRLFNGLESDDFEVLDRAAKYQER